MTFLSTMTTAGAYAIAIDLATRKNDDRTARHCETETKERRWFSRPFLGLFRSRCA
jgi:hypothetical protein